MTDHTTDIQRESDDTEETVHVPVLLQEVVESLAIQSTDVVVDCTINGGGHASALASRLSREGTLIGIDLDEDALARAQKKLSTCVCKTFFVPSNYGRFDAILDELEYETVSKVLIDLGLSSDQLERSGRGFSFDRDEPLMMTFQQHPDEQAVTAHLIVNRWEEESIMSILRGFGEEEHAPRIARAIVEARAQQPIDTTAQLSAIVTQALPRWRVRGARRHPATKTFQALRIAVNEEYTALEQGLAAIVAHLAPSGRVAVISFQSIEDRLVKHFFRAAEASGVGKVLTKKPLLPTSEEIRANPRSRSAKLRVFEKIII